MPVTFQPENDLERSLVKAVHDPAHRHQFYRDLLKATVYVIQPGPAPSTSAARTVEQGSRLSIITMDVRGKRYVPFFSSLTRLQEAIEGEVAYAALNARTLLEITRGTPLILNPYSAYGKEFTPTEVEAILDGSIWETTLERTTIEKSSKIFISELTEYPAELIEALRKAFRQQKNVKRAWVALYHNSSDGLPPHLLVALETEGNEDAISQQIGELLTYIDVPNPPVDIIFLHPGHSLWTYFQRKMRPFYTRKRFVFF